MVNWYVWKRAVFAGFGGFMFGYDTGAINGVKDMPGFRNTFNIPYEGSNNGSSLCNDNVEESAIIGLVVSILSIGCMIGALLAGALSDLVGRKPAIITGGVVVTIGGALQSGAYYLWMLLLGRIIAGLGIGILFMVVPVYIAELAPKELRGRLVTFVSTYLTAGVLSGFVADSIFERFEFGWRIPLGLQCLFGATLAIGMVFLPETPRWLVKKHKYEKAAKILARIHQNIPEECVQEELREIQTAVSNVQGNNIMLTLKLFFTWKSIHRVILGTCLLMYNRFVGLPMITHYSVAIFCKIGVPSYVATVMVGLSYFLTTILTLFLVDKVGRKPLLLVGALKMTVTLLLAATLLLEFRVEEGENKGVGYFVVVLICFFVFSHSYSFGAVPWIVSSEIHPLKVRAMSVSVTTSVFWGSNITVTLLTPVLLASPLQTHGTFYIFAGVSLTAFLFVLFTLPETKGESLERIEVLFAKPWLERANPLYYLRCGFLSQCCRQTRQYEVSQLHQDGSDDEMQQLAQSDTLTIDAIDSSV